MSTRPRLRLWILALTIVCVLVVVGWVAALQKRASWQREAVAALQALGAVVTYDYQLDPSFRSARTHKEFMAACENVTDRREVPDPDHDGLAWLRRLTGPDILHHVVSVNLAYSHDANGDNRHEPEKRFHEDMLLLSLIGGAGNTLRITP